MISIAEKTKIQNKLEDYCNRIGNQSKAANSLRNVTPTTINNIINNKWDLVSDGKWRTVGSQVGYSTKERIVVETSNFNACIAICNDASVHRNVLAFTDSAGSGKSFATKYYAEQNKNVYRIECNEFWNKKQFLSELLSSIGRKNSGLDLNELLNEILRFIKSQDRPLIILDEFDKVNDSVLYFFISLYNQLEDQCGLVLCSTDYLEKRIKRGVMANKKGYQEIFSRIGRKFIKLPGVNGTDITAICLANGINTKDQIKEIINDSEFDLRRVQRKIHALKNSQLTVKQELETSA